METISNMDKGQRLAGIGRKERAERLNVMCIPLFTFGTCEYRLFLSFLLFLLGFLLVKDAERGT